MPTTRSAAGRDTATSANKSKDEGGIFKNTVPKVKPKNPRRPPGSKGKSVPSTEVVEKDQTPREVALFDFTALSEEDKPTSASKIPVPAIRTAAAEQQKATPSSSDKQISTRAFLDNDTPSNSIVSRRPQSARIQMRSKSKVQEQEQQKSATPTESRKSSKEKDKMSHVVNSWTPTLERRKKAAAECRIVDHVDTFPGRLDYKMKYGMPVTSTPKPPPFSQHHDPAKTSTTTGTSTAVTTKDIENCFGFDDDSVEDNYSDLISPIAMISKPRRFPLPVKKPRPVIDSVTNAPSTSNPSNKVLQENNSSEEGLRNVPSTSAPKQKSVIKSSIEKRKDDVKKSHKQKKQTQSKSKKKIEVENAGKQKRCSTDLYEFDVQNSQTLAEEVSRMDEIGEPSNLCQGIGRTEKEKEGDEDFNALLHKYGKGNDDEGEMHFDSANLKRTYHHTKHREIPVLKRPKQQPSSRKSKKKSCGTSSRANKGHSVESDSDDSDLDPIIKQWLEKKNKEFNDVLHIPLLIKRINADTSGDGDSQ